MLDIIEQMFYNVHRKQTEPPKKLECLGNKAEDPFRFRCSNLILSSLTPREHAANS